MLNLCAPPKLPQGTPPWLSGSWLLRPWVVLADISAGQLEAWLGNSKAAQCLGTWYHRLFAPIHARLAPFTLLHQGLKTLHLLSLVAVFVLSTVATTETIGMATVGSFAIVLLRGLTSRLTLKPTMVDMLVLAFFLTAFVATAFSSYVHTSLIGMAKFSVFLMGFLSFRVYLAEDRSKLLWLLAVLVGLGMLEACVGFYQYANHVQPLATWQDTSLNPEDQLTRIFGTLHPSNPNLLAGFLVPCVAAGAGLGLLCLVRGHPWLAIALGSITLLIMAALVLTGSRGGYLALLAMGLTLFLGLGHLLWHEPTLKARYRLKALWLLVLIGAVLAIAGGIMAVPAIRTRFLSIFAMREDSSNSYRLNVWFSTLQMIRDNWLLGIGPGNDTFKQVYGLYMIPGYNALSAYSIFLEIWAEQGIFGLLAFLCLLGTVLLKVCLAYYTRLPLAQKTMLLFLLTGILGSVVYGLFDTIWYRPSVNLLFWLFIAGFSVYSEE